MIELQKRGMTLSRRDLESKEPSQAAGKVKGHGDSTYSAQPHQAQDQSPSGSNSHDSSVVDSQTKVSVSVGNKFELLTGCSSDDGD